MRTPPTPEQAARNKKVALGCLLPIGALFVIVVAIVLSDSSESGDKPSANTPAYQVVKQDPDGNKRDVVVEVDTTEDLRAVFDAVTDNLSEEAGYYITINCSTGATENTDNRLANGQYAIGRMGRATTGLDEGGTEFSTNDDRTCPATEPTKTSAFLRPTPEQEKTLITALTAIDPGLTVKEERAISRSVGVCDDIRQGKDKTTVIENAAYRYDGGNASVDEAKAEKIVAAIEDAYCTP